MCTRARSAYCEDSLTQIQSNWSVPIKNRIVGAISNSSGVRISISFISDPLLANGQLQMTVYFTSPDPSWSQSQQTIV